MVYFRLGGSTVINIDRDWDETLYFLQSSYGDTSVFYKYDPQTILAIRETDLEMAKRRIYERQTALRIARAIKSKLNPRQFKVWRLRSEGRTFPEIAKLLKVSRATIFNDWKQIRKVAREYAHLM